MSQLDRIEGKVDDLGTRLATVETWKAEVEGAYKVLKVAWTLFAAVAGVVGWAIAHWMA